MTRLRVIYFHESLTPSFVFYPSISQTKCRKLYLLNDMLVCVSLPSERLKFAVQLQDIDVLDDVTPASSNIVANSVLRAKGLLFDVSL